MLQVFRAAILKLSTVFVYFFLSCHFENFGSKTPCLLLIGWKQDLRMTLIGELHWVITLKIKTGVTLFIWIAHVFKDTCFLGLGNVISLLLELGMHWIISLRQNEVWLLWTFTRACMSTTKNDWKSFGNAFFVI